MFGSGFFRNRSWNVQGPSVQSLQKLQQYGLRYLSVRNFRLLRDTVQPKNPRATTIWDPMRLNASQMIAETVIYDDCSSVALDELNSHCRREQIEYFAESSGGRRRHTGLVASSRCVHVTHFKWSPTYQKSCLGMVASIEPDFQTSDRQASQGRALRLSERRHA